MLTRSQLSPKILLVSLYFFFYLACNRSLETIQLSINYSLATPTQPHTQIPPYTTNPKKMDLSKEPSECPRCGGWHSNISHCNVAEKIESRLPFDPKACRRCGVRNHTEARCTIGSTKRLFTCLICGSADHFSSDHGTGRFVEERQDDSYNHSTQPQRAQHNRHQQRVAFRDEQGRYEPRPYTTSRESREYAPRLSPPHRRYNEGEDLILSLTRFLLKRERDDAQRQGDFHWSPPRHPHHWDDFSTPPRPARMAATPPRQWRSPPRRRSVERQKPISPQRRYRPDTPRPQSPPVDRDGMAITNNWLAQQLRTSQSSRRNVRRQRNKLERRCTDLERQISGAPRRQTPPPSEDEEYNV